MAFVARNRAEVDAFHATARTRGGTDNGPPGIRDTAEVTHRLRRRLRVRSGRQQHRGGFSRRLKSAVHSGVVVKSSLAARCEEHQTACLFCTRYQKLATTERMPVGAGS